MKASIKVFASVLLSCLLGGLFGITTAKASAEVGSFDKTIETTILGINNENLDQGTCFVMVLSDTDYMTTEWSNTDYKWKNAEELTKFEDRVKIDPTKNTSSGDRCRCFNPGRRNTGGIQNHERIHRKL